MATVSRGEDPAEVKIHINIDHELITLTVPGWVDIALVLRVGLTTLVGLLSLAALLAEHWPRKLAGYKPKFSPIPVYVQFLLAGAVLSAFSSIWNDIGSARAEWNRDNTAELRFNHNVEQLSVIARDLGRANKGINEQAAQSCDQFTTNMANLDDASEELQSITHSLGQAMEMTDNVLVLTQELAMPIDTIKVYATMAFRFIGGSTSRQVLSRALNEMRPKLMTFGTKWVTTKEHMDVGVFNYDKIADTILPLGKIMNGSLFESIRIYEGDIVNSLGYEPVGMGFRPSILRLTDSSLVVDYIDVPHVMYNKNLTEPCRHQLCLEGKWVALTYGSNYDQWMPKDLDEFGVIFQGGFDEEMNGSQDIYEGWRTYYKLGPIQSARGPTRR